MGALRSPRTRHRRAPDAFIDLALPYRVGRLELPLRDRRASSLAREKRASSQLIRRCDCNDSPPPSRASAVLSATLGMQRPVLGRAGVKAVAPFQRAAAASIGKWTN